MQSGNSNSSPHIEISFEADTRLKIDFLGLKSLEVSLYHA